MLYLSSMASRLGPAVQESVKIINYFDALLSEQVGIDGILRATGILTGCGAGVTTADGKFSRRITTAGNAEHYTSKLNSDWMTSPAGRHAHVWIERRPGSHSTDSMVLERLALVMEVALERRRLRTRRPLIEALLDPTATENEKAIAAANFHLSPETTVRALATPARIRQEASLFDTVIPTSTGLLRAHIIQGDSATGTAGLGISVSLKDFQISWRGAVTALRLTAPEQPVVHADDLGVLLQLDELKPEDSDLTTLIKAHQSFPWTIPTLTALIATNSVRAAATQLGLHHSTVQARQATLTKVLGFSPHTPLGRTRAATLLVLWKLNTTKF